jgi:hypothetical protein
VSVSLSTDANGRHTVAAGSVSVRCESRRTAMQMAGYALDAARGP